MHIEHYIPAASLKPFIRNYLVIACDEQQENRLLPDTNLTLALRYKGQVEDLTAQPYTLPLSLFSGLRKSPRRVRYAPDSGNVLVIFREAGAAAFFRQPLQELFEASVSLDHFIPASELSVIEEQLATAPNSVARVAVVEQFLRSRLQPGVTDPLISAALEQIQIARGQLKIRELAASLYISQDAFEKRFRKVVGTSPKQFCFIVRMKAITAGNKARQTFTDIAFNAGYADQPHFNKDFKLFTGQAPTDFFSAPPLW